MEVNKQNTIVIIPAYNESRTIGEVVKAITSRGYNAVVVDDGSTDGTAEIAARSGARVMSNKANLGKGKSLRQAIDYAAGIPGCEWVVMMDADGQHHPDDLESLALAASASPDVDMVVGNRMDQTKNMPAVRYLTNKFMSWVLSRMCGQDIPDSQCGYRMIRSSALKGMRLEADRFDIESEILIEAARKRLKIRSARVRTIYGAEISKIDPLRDTIKFFALVCRFYFPKK